MATYSILRQRNPKLSEIPVFCEPGFLFNDGVHLLQQRHQALHLLTMINHDTQLAEARCAFFARKPDAVSPAAAPFGSVEFSAALPDPPLDQLLHALTDEARLAGATLLRLVNYPHCYAPQQAQRLTQRLMDQGFRIADSHPTSFLPVTDIPFDHRLEAAERRRLRKCRDAEFRFSHWLRPDITDVVNFIVTNRRQLGYRLTISPHRLTQLLQNFPDQFPVFVVRHQQTIASLTVAVRVRSDILYTFLPASDPDYNPFSPMVMLTDGVYMYCRQQRIGLLDLGVSLDNNNQPKPSLMQFKHRLGALQSPKLVFEKAL